MPFVEKKESHVILKIDDIQAHLNDGQKSLLYSLIDDIKQGRAGHGQKENHYYITNLDEPYAESVFEAIRRGEILKGFTESWDVSLAEVLDEIITNTATAYGSIIDHLDKEEMSNDEKKYLFSVLTIVNNELKDTIQNMNEAVEIAKGIVAEEKEEAAAEASDEPSEAFNEPVPPLPGGGKNES